ncbi:MAG TPA: universal stress protein [Solirubrobacteraceae bacterium]|nr:universal stress protein [Solirubrobacteraceae bacterium]
MYKAIVVGTDGSETAKRAVEEAATLAKALGSDLHIVAAYEPVRGARISGAPDAAAKIWAPLPDAQVDATVEQAAVAVRVGGVEARTHTLRGDPADALVEVAAKVGAELIVVGNQGMHSARRFVMGSVPNKVSHKARSSVLIVSTDRA